MIWLLKDFDLLSVLLRAAVLSLEALTLGGIAFLLFAALPTGIAEGSLLRLRKIAGWAALALFVAETLSISVSAAILIGGSGFSLSDVASADFFLAGIAILIGAGGLFLLLRSSSRAALFIGIPFALLILFSSVSMSHAAARMDHRIQLLSFTALHHIGTAAWIGAMPFLLIALRKETSHSEAARYTRRFSTMAIVCVSLLLLSGIGMALFYVGSWQGIYGTTYGIMILAKVYLLLLILGMGAGNFFLVRQIKIWKTDRAPVPLLTRLRRFSEAEIGLGFTAILTAASLTSQPPAIDLTQDRLTMHEIVERMRWVQPRLTSPSFQQLVPPSSVQVAVQKSIYSAGTANDAIDRAWSEYNHHWAGLIVLAAGLLALLASTKRFRWAQHWPLLFIGLAIFIVVRADPECWPLGPRPFWLTFSSPDVLQHRLYALLITAFALFEWAVETGRLRSRVAAYVFPLMCAAGGALLLTHSHALGNIKEEMLAEMSHTPVALLGATAGWSRWLQLRLPQERASRIGSYIWPVCLILVGIVLLDYRES